MSTLLAHLKLHRVLYVVLPLFIGLTLVAIRAIYWLTGRPPTEDMSILVVFAYNCIKIALAIALAVIVKAHDKLNKPSGVIDDWKDALISRGSTIALVALFLHFLSQ